MSGSDEEQEVCPLCVEVLDVTDRNFYPCSCGYQVCLYCWNHIKRDLNGLCPACRTPYTDEPHKLSPVDREEIVRKKKEKRRREKEDRKERERLRDADRQKLSERERDLARERSLAPSVALFDKKNAPPVPLPPPPPYVPPAQSQLHPLPADHGRAALKSIRVVQRNLVYVVGLPLSIASEEMLRRPEYFGQYGKINRVAINRQEAVDRKGGREVHCSAYVTFACEEDARACIQAADGFEIESRVLKASFGTTKYCSLWLRYLPCTIADCGFLHDVAPVEDSFTKQEIQDGSNFPCPPPPAAQVTVGQGGPSGTGTRPKQPVLPMPRFEAPTMTRSLSGGGLGLGSGAQPAMPIRNPWQQALLVTNVVPCVSRGHPTPAEAAHPRASSSPPSQAIGAPQAPNSPPCADQSAQGSQAIPLVLSGRKHSRHQQVAQRGNSGLLGLRANSVELTGLAEGNSPVPHRTAASHSDPSSPVAASSLLNVQSSQDEQPVLHLSTALTQPSPISLMTAESDLLTLKDIGSPVLSSLGGREVSLPVSSLRGSGCLVEGRTEQAGVRKAETAPVEGPGVIGRAERATRKGKSGTGAAYESRHDKNEGMHLFGDSMWSPLITSTHACPRSEPPRPCTTWDELPALDSAVFFRWPPGLPLPQQEDLAACFSNPSPAEQREGHWAKNGRTGEAVRQPSPKASSSSATGSLASLLGLDLPAGGALAAQDSGRHNEQERPSSPPNWLREPERPVISRYRFAKGDSEEAGASVVTERSLSPMASEKSEGSAYREGHSRDSLQSGIAMLQQLLPNVNLSYGTYGTGLQDRWSENGRQIWDRVPKRGQAMR